MKSKNNLLLLTLLLIPTVVFAKSSDSSSIFGLIFIHAFITPHMTLFFHVPFAKTVTGGNQASYKVVLWIMIIGRIVILLIGDIVYGEIMLLIDFITVFVGAIIINSITWLIVKSLFGDSYNVSSVSPTATLSTVRIIRDYSTSAILGENVKYREIAEDSWYATAAIFAKKVVMTLKECNNCHGLNPIDNKYCTSCGTMFGSELSKNGYCPKCRAKLNPGVKYCVNCGIEIGNYIINPASIDYKEEEGTIDSFFIQSEEAILNSIIDKELEENHFDKSMVIPGLRKRKLILSLLFALVTFIAISLIFFHLPLAYYFVYFIFLVIYIISMFRYNIKKFIIKQIKSRPDEKINNVVASVVASATKKTGGFEYIAMFLVAIILPLAIFSKQRIFYEKADDGYVMRFYAFGWSDMTKATIPETYKGEPVVALRGNAFSNMFFLKEVELPDSIKEIRGQAFKNDYLLEKVNIPSELEYLGGGAFYNCESIREIILPDTVTTIGGEAFYGASRLETVVLPNSITEIRGNTFQNCVSLKEIKIPDSVVRIGGHAFHGDSDLKKVEISPSSQLKELGSSAFRECYSLEEIYLPRSATYEKNTFKGSSVVIKNYIVDEKGNPLTFKNRQQVSFYLNDKFEYDDDYGGNYSIVLSDIRIENGGVYTYRFGVFKNGEAMREVVVYSSNKTGRFTNDMYYSIDSYGSNYITLNIQYNLN